VQVAEEEQDQDDRQRDADEPEKTTLQHDAVPPSRELAIERDGTATVPKLGLAKWPA
jgi:hypothetical protein